MTPVAIYLDNAATTRPSESVVEAMARSQRDHFGNPSSGHFLGREPRRVLQDAREFLRGTLGAAELVFTSGGSEADMMGVLGAAMVRPPGRVLVGAADHPAVLALEEPLRRSSHRLTRIPVTSQGDLDPETLFELMGPDVAVVSILHGHNELGTLCQLEELVGLVRRVSPRAHVHVDLVQTYGKVAFDMDAMAVDSVAASGHKFHGPRGAGFLALRSQARIGAIMKAGGQEGGLRGGTENVAAALGVAVAAEEAFNQLSAAGEHTRHLADLLLGELHSNLPGVERLGHPQRALPHILSLRIPGTVGETLLERASERGVAFSTGSACHSAREDRDGSADDGNHVLEAIGMDRRVAREVVRFSFSRENSEAEVRSAAAIVIDEVRKLAAMSPSPTKTP
jgi:cysteine desulfurase